MKKVSALILSVLVLLNLAGCTEDNQSTALSSQATLTPKVISSSQSQQPGIINNQSSIAIPSVVATPKTDVTAKSIVTPKVTQQTTVSSKPAVVQQQSSGDTYTNTAGREVKSPTYSDTVPVGASAQCKDGTYSFSESRRGTCSGHGGVAIWL